MGTMRCVVETRKEKGNGCGEEHSEMPETEDPVVFSAHGVAKAVPAEAAARNMFYLDATCPLVSKVHKEAQIHFKRGREVVLIGHAGHPEVVGTMGQLPDGAISLVETVEDVARFEPCDPANLSWVSQTTLSVDDTHAIVEALTARFPEIVSPHKDDICYATQNRQNAVKERSRRAQVVLVGGAPTSSNSNRLVELAAKTGARAYLVETSDDIDPTWLAGADCVGVTAGASAPEVLVEQVVERLRALAPDGFVLDALPKVDEGVVFQLPAELRHAGR